MFGNGEPRADRTATEALWMALGALEAETCSNVRAGIAAAGSHRVGLVRVFDAGGERMVDLDLAAPSPCYGEIKWVSAPVYEMKVEDLLARSSSPS